MIESMIKKIRGHLPLKIEHISWDGTVLNMNGAGWSFSTMSAWRVVTKTNVLFGCYDKQASDELKSLCSLDIKQADLQSDLLKIDPLFTISNGAMLEIFSTDTYEPWTLFLKSEGVYVATPGEPSLFETNKS